LQVAYKKGIKFVIQEPWWNPHELTSYYHKAMGYYLVYALKENNLFQALTKKLNANKWKMKLGSHSHAYTSIWYSFISKNNLDP